MKTGIVFEGGGMRGLFSTGIIDVLLEEEITVDGMVGVSAGACLCCNYKSRQIGRALRYNILMRNDKKYMSLSSLFKTGDFIGAEYAYHYVPTYVDYFDREAFKANPMKFELVCTDVYTGKPVYKEIDEVTYETLEWIRASASLPLVSRPVTIGGHTMLDGGMTDAIPLRHWQESGYEKNIVVLTQPRDYRKKKTSLMPLFRLVMHKYPKVVEAMAHRHEMYNRQLDYLIEQERLGKTLLLFPPHKLDIGRIEQDADKMRAVHQLGIDTARTNLERIREFLN